MRFLGLVRCHDPGTSPGGVGNLEDHLGAGGYGDGDFTRKVLGSIEGDKAIDADVFVVFGEGAEACVKGERLAGKPIQAVLYGGRGYV